MFLRIKWKCLRDTYKKELNKNPGTYTGMWRFFKPLKFLVFKPPYESENDSDEPSEKETEETNVTSDVPVIKYEPTLQWSENSIPADTKPREEEFDVLFLQSLTPYFKQLDPMRKLVIRSKMQDMLFNEICAQKSGTGPQYD
ncbi:hypothetical protein O3G_MSEX000826 [Manduca sexta]|nr:hypothetical protein O3G_MSEX000826 [Manduca sexta]